MELPIEELQKTYQFYAKIPYGYVPKITIDAISAKISKTVFNIKQDGIYITVTDRDTPQDSHIMWDVNWPGKHCSPYICSQDLTISVNSKNLQKTLKTVKKKDAIILKIKKLKPNEQQGQLLIKTVPAKGISEEATTQFQIIKSIIPLVPSNYFDEEAGEDVIVYGLPHVMTSNDFLKVKKLTGLLKNGTVDIVAQRDNYIHFFAKDGEILGYKVPSGSLIHKKDCKNNFADEYSDDMYPDLYKQKYHSSLLDCVLKLPPMCKQMQFYYPKIPGYPFKIEITPSVGFGEIRVFIKDAEQIENIEEDIRKRPRSK